MKILIYTLAILWLASVITETFYPLGAYMEKLWGFAGSIFGIIFSIVGFFAFILSVGMIIVKYDINIRG